MDMYLSPTKTNSTRTHTTDHCSSMARHAETSLTHQPTLVWTECGAEWIAHGLTAVLSASVPLVVWFFVWTTLQAIQSPN